MNSENRVKSTNIVITNPYSTGLSEPQLATIQRYFDSGDDQADQKETRFQCASMVLDCRKDFRLVEQKQATFQGL